MNTEVTNGPGLVVEQPERLPSRPRVLALIPARAGSKGIPGKNWREVDGVPLFELQAIAAKRSGVIESVVVSTDGQADSPHVDETWTRQFATASDSASIRDVLIEHSAEIRGVHQYVCEPPAPKPDAVMVLYPTYPLRTAQDVRLIYWEYARDPSRVLVGIKPAPCHPQLLAYADGDKLKPVTGAFDVARRQDRQPCYELCLFALVVPVARIPHVTAQCWEPDARAMMIDPAKALDVDTLEDLEEAERRVALQER